MSKQIQTINDENELLALLEANPLERYVGYDDREDLAVFEGDISKLGHVIAWINKEGTANKLLDAAYLVDFTNDLSAWQSLPLRYGPFCSTWVLPSHRGAPQKPGA